jgi:hypothetical protein
MPETPNFDPNLNNIENLEQRVRAIQKVQADLYECLDRNEMLNKSDVDISRRFLVSAPKNDIVPANHYRIALVPQVRQPALYGVARVEIGVPVYNPRTAGKVPRSLVESSELLRDPQHPTAQFIPGNDIFMDIIDGMGRVSGRYLLNPEGIYAYSGVEDIVPLRTLAEDDITPEAVLNTSTEEAAHDHLFTVDETAAEYSLFSAEYEWGIFAIIDSYEPELIDNVRRSI